MSKPLRTRTDESEIMSEKEIFNLLKMTHYRKNPHIIIRLIGNKTFELYARSTPNDF